MHLCPIFIFKVNMTEQLQRSSEALNVASLSHVLIYWKNKMDYFLPAILWATVWPEVCRLQPCFGPRQLLRKFHHAWWRIFSSTEGANIARLNHNGSVHPSQQLNTEEIMTPVFRQKVVNSRWCLYMGSIRVNHRGNGGSGVEVNPKRWQKVIMKYDHQKISICNQILTLCN